MNEIELRSVSGTIPLGRANSFRSFLVTRLSALLAGMAFVLVSLGGLVRNKGAGLSCPDWPLCFGQVIPPMNVQVFLEWFHRLIAGGVSTLLLTVSVVVLSDPHLRKKAGRYCGVALGILFVQIVLGGMTVLGLLSPKWVVSHLATGIAFLGTLAWISRSLWDKNQLKPTFSIQAKFAAAVAGLVYFQIVLGGLVSSQYAGLACPDFPTCNGSWIPPFEGLVRFQFLHRLGALAVTIAVATLALSLKQMPFLRGVLLALLSVQLFLGIGSVIWQIPVLMSVAHLAVAALLFATLLMVVYEFRRS